MHIEVVTDIEVFRDMREEWDSLFISMPSYSLPLSHEWLFAWWQAFGNKKQLHIICVYDGDRLVAIAPLMKEQSTYRGIPVNCLRLMTNGHTPFSDVLFDFNSTPEQKKRMLELIVCSAKEDILVFGKISEDSFIYQIFSSGQKLFGHRYGVKPSLLTPIISIVGEWDDFLKSKSRKFRKNLNNKLNRFKKAGDFTIDCLKITSRDHPALNEMLEISVNSWKTTIHNDLGSNPAGREFLLKLVDEFGGRDSIRLWMMRKAGYPVAYEFHVYFREVVYPLRADFNENYRDFSPGSILEFTALKTLFEVGAISKYYSCADDYWYLSNWTADLKKQFNVEIFSKNIKSLVLYMFEYSIARRLKNIRDKFVGNK